MHKRLLTCFWLFLVFFVMVLALCYGGLNAPMYYDSAGNLAEKALVFEWQGLRGVLNLFPQRPLPVATFYVNYLMTGMDPRFFRVMNCGFLAATSVIVVLLVDLLLRITGPTNESNASARTWLSVGLGLLFLVHPLQTYQTLYIWQRMALMACFFSYASLAVYLAVRTGAWRDPFTGYLLCAVLFCCALLSKENSVTLPGILVLAEIAFFRQDCGSVVKRGAACLAVALVAVTAVSFVQHPHGNAHMGSGILNTIQTYYAESGLTLYEVALTQARMLFHYAAILALPSPSTVQLISPQVISRSLLEPPVTLAAVAGVVTALVAAVCLLGRRPLVTFGILFYVANLLPEGFLVPQYAFFGYRAVMPMLGLLLILADSISRLLAATETSRVGNAVRAGLFSLLAGAVILYAATTAIRAEIWKDPIRFWTETVAEFPQGSDWTERKVAAHALGNLGNALYSAGRYEEAAEYYERARELGPGNPRTLINLAATYVELGNLEKARTLLRQALELDPRLTAGYKNLGILSLRQGKPDEAVKHFGKAIELSPHDASLYEALGEALLAQGKDDDAAASFQKALETQPDWWEAHNALGALCAKQGRLAEAVAHYQRALERNPGNREIRANLDTAREAIRLQTGSP